MEFTCSKSTAETPELGTEYTHLEHNPHHAPAPPPQI